MIIKRLGLMGLFALCLSLAVLAYQNTSESLDDLFRDTCQDTPFDWKLIKAQCIVESGMKLDAIGEAGEEGPMQLMPDTVKRMNVTDTFDWNENVGAAVAYMEHLYELFYTERPEIERIKFTLAAYNGGVGYIDVAFRLARYARISTRKWDDVKKYLLHPDCHIGGRRPNAEQIICYVEKVMKEYEKLKGDNDAKT